MKIIKNNGQIKELTNKYILEGIDNKNRKIYAKVGIYNIFSYLLMKLGIIKWNYKNGPTFK